MEIISIVQQALTSLQLGTGNENAYIVLLTVLAAFFAVSWVFKQIMKIAGWIFLVALGSAFVMAAIEHYKFLLGVS